MKNLPQKIRSKKLISRVDLTAMVSVSFLLIIFFMLVGELSKPKVMEYNLPHYDDDEWRFTGCVLHDEKRTLTLLLDDDNQIITYSGLLFFPIERPKKYNMEKAELEKNY